MTWSIFDTTGFPPRWYCGQWTAAHGWTHIVADLAIFAAYFTIPVLLIYFIRKRNDLPFPKLIWLFAAFILSCGTVHMIEATIFWHPWYRLSAVIKVMTAIVSWVTVLAMVPLLPRLLAMPGLEELNRKLQTEVEARRQAQTQLTYVIEQAPNAMVLVNRDGEIVFINRMTETLFGYDRAELMGKPLGDLIPEWSNFVADRQRENGMEDATHPLGKRSPGIRGRRKDSSQFRSELAVNPVSTQYGEGYLASVVDITGITRVEENLRNALEAAPIALITVDDDGSINFVNHHAEVIFGYDRDELVGQPIELLVPERYREDHVAFRHVYQAAPTARSMAVERELHGRRKDGSEFPVEVGLGPLDSSRGSSVLCAVTDITQRKLAEHRLQKRSDELARKNQELDEFTRVASHDLQEPLRTIRSFAEMLRKNVGDDLPPRAAKDLNFITDASERMSKLIHDLLALSRAARSQLGNEWVHLDECVRTASCSLSVAIRESGAELTVPELPVVRGDSTLLTLLFQNLIGNAVKYRDPDRTPRIEMTVNPSEDEWTFGVRDNGIGIDPRFAEDVFAPFKRLHGRSEYQGTGIGLAICRKIVERHKGRIWVEPAPEQGAHFKFTLPGAAPKSQVETASAENVTA